MLLLWEFEFHIHHRLGAQHAVADYMSWLESGEPAGTVYDDLPDANIFDIDATTPHGKFEDD